MTRWFIAAALVWGLFMRPSLTSAQSNASGLETADWRFIDGVLEAQKQSHHFAGAVVVVVSDGQIAFEKGYGFADYAERAPVDAQRTLFRIASNTKMFVWTAVMQLVEESKLDLRVDVNRYLKGLQIPNTFPEPITLEHLMSHTAGFEDRIIGLFAKSQESRPLAELLAKGMPARVYPPGSVTAYSNYGAALAALIVEQVSGIPFGTYLENRILKPLAMNHATILQPVPSPLSADLSKGYQWTDGRLKEQPFEYVPWAPAGAMSASGTDMGRFMMAHLNEGALGAARILRADTARAMRERLPSFSPKLSGMFHGFMEGNVNGETLFGHGGDTIWFHSLTAMFPTRRLGVFVAYNTDSGQRAVQEFLASFVEHFFPSPLAKETLPSKESRESLKRFVGRYSVSRASETDLTKVIKLVAAVSVSVDPDGYLLTRSGNEVTRWRQIEPLLFVQVDGGRRLAFRDNDRGDVTALCSSPICVVVMLKEPWWNGQVPQMTWFGFSLAIFAAALVGFPIAAVLQRKQPKPIGAKLARLAAWATSVMFVAGTAAFAVGFVSPNDIVFAVPTATKVALSFWAASSLLAIGLCVSTVQAWRRHWWRAAGRVCLTLVCGAAVASIAWLYHWNLLGWRY